MSTIQDFLGELAGEPVIVSAIIFIVVFAAALAVVWRFVAPAPGVSRRPPSAADLARRPAAPVLHDAAVPETIQDFVGGQRLQLGGSRRDPFLGTKRAMWKLFRLLSVVIVAALLTLTFVSYRESTAGTGDVLLSIVLGVVTLIAFLHLLKLDRRYNPDPDPVLKAELHQAVQSDLEGKIREALSGGVNVEWNFASPEVHRIDNENLGLARAMSDEGKPLDEICRTIETEYVDWDPARQQVFRHLIKAALEHT